MSIWDLHRRFCERWNTRSQQSRRSRKHDQENEPETDDSEEHDSGDSFEGGVPTDTSLSSIPIVPSSIPSSTSFPTRRPTVLVNLATSASLLAKASTIPNLVLSSSEFQLPADLPESEGERWLVDPSLLLVPARGGLREEVEVEVVAAASSLTFAARRARSAACFRRFRSFWYSFFSSGVSPLGILEGGWMGGMWEEKEGRRREGGGGELSSSESIWEGLGELPK